MRVKVPGRNDLVIENVLLDVNGTLALDGRLLEGVAARIAQLRELTRVVIVTADNGYHVVYQSPSDPLMRLEVRIDDQPLYNNLIDKWLHNESIDVPFGLAAVTNPLQTIEVTATP